MEQFPIIDIIIGSIVFLLFAKWSIKKTPGKVKVLFQLQLITLYALLVIVHVYAFYNLKTFPALGEDSLFYDKLARYLSESIRRGEFDINFDNYLGYNPISYRTNKYTYIGSHIPYGFVVPLSLVYTIFGYMPFIAKVFNVFAFHLAAKVFYNILVHYSIRGEALKLSLIIFAFFPPLMVSSFSFVKESLLMFAFLSSVLFLLREQLFKSIPWLILAILNRPYTPLIFLIVFTIYYRRFFIQKFGSYVFVVGILFFGLSLISFAAFDMQRFFLESGYTLFYDYKDASKHVKASGVLELLSIISSSPLLYVEYFFYGWFNALFKPDPWHFKISNFFYTQDYINAYKFNVSYLAYYLYGWILYFMHFTFLRYFLNRKLYRGINFRFEIILIFVLVTSIIFLRAVELRYLIMSVFPFALVVYAKIKNVNFRLSISTTYTVYIVIIMGLLLVPIIF